MEHVQPSCVIYLWSWVFELWLWWLIIRPFLLPSSSFLRVMCFYQLYKCSILLTHVSLIVRYNSLMHMLDSPNENNENDIYLLRFSFWEDKTINGSLIIIKYDTFLSYDKYVSTIYRIIYFLWIYQDSLIEGIAFKVDVIFVWNNDHLTCRLELSKLNEWTMLMFFHQRIIFW